MKKLLLGIIGIMFAFSADAASLSKNEIMPGEKFSIYGSNFGSKLDTYSSVCFNNSSSCIHGDKFYGDGYSWTNSKIDLAMQSWADISGSIIVYGNGTKQECITGYYSDYCYDTTVSVEKARISYKVKPVIFDVDKVIAKPGDKVVITGAGFGNNGGAVFFGSYRGYPIRWSSESIEVRIPSKINTTVSKIKISSSNGLSYTYDDFTVSQETSSDPFSYFQTEHFETINLQKAWNITKGSSDIIVAIIDDGVYINHPDLRQNIWINKKENIGNNLDDDGNGYVDDIYGWDFVGNYGEMTTRGTHGTMVAGIIGAVGNNDEGIAGVNWNARLMPLIVCASATNCPTSNIISAIYYAVDNGANVINLSLSTSGVTAYSNAYDDAIRYAYDRGVVIVSAAGNGDIEGGIGQDLGFIPQSPVCNDNNQNMVIGVGSFTMDGKYRTNWTNYGKCVDTYAPGEAVVSTAVPAYSTIKGFYDLGSGTSYSAPYVTGLVVLLKSKYPTMSNIEIRDRIIKHSIINNTKSTINVYETLIEPYTFKLRSNGTLIRSTNSADIYLVEQGKKRLIPDYNIFVANKFNALNVITVTPVELLQYPTGELVGVPIPEGALIKATNGIDIYIVKYIGTKKFKRLVLSPLVFNNYGHLKWEDVMDVNQSTLNSFTTSELVRAVGDDKIYRLYPQGDKGQKRLIKNNSVLTRLGLDPDSIYEINSFDRESYVTGLVLK